MQILEANRSSKNILKIVSGFFSSEKKEDFFQNMYNAIHTFDDESVLEIIETVKDDDIIGYFGRYILSDLKIFFDEIKVKFANENISKATPTKIMDIMNKSCLLIKSSSTLESMLENFDKIKETKGSGLVSHVHYEISEKMKKVYQEKIKPMIQGLIKEIKVLEKYAKRDDSTRMR